MKTSIKIFCFTAFLFCLSLFLPFCNIINQSAEANDQLSATSTAATFPADFAGLSAYVKLNSFDPTYFETLQNSFYYKVSDIGTTHIIGVKQYIADDIAKNVIEINVYLGSDGWLIAYLPRTEIQSKIIDFKANANLDNTFLKQAINDTASVLNASYTDAIQYYDFAYPAANRISLITKSLGYNNNDDSFLSDYFNIYIPGTVYKADYAATLDTGGTDSLSLYLNDNFVAYWPYGQKVNYGALDLNSFSSNKSHKIGITRTSFNIRGKINTLIIYQAPSTP